jgi:hypothetical protein
MKPLSQQELEKMMLDGYQQLPEGQDDDFKSIVVGLLIKILEELIENKKLDE